MTHIYYGMENEEAQAVFMGCPGREVHFLPLLPAFLTVCNAVYNTYLIYRSFSHLKSHSNGHEVQSSLGFHNNQNS